MGNYWNKRSVLVTGGAGFIGSHVVAKLVSRGAQVTVLDNLQNGSLKNLAHVRNSIKFIRGDCTQAVDAQSACNGQEVVMNLAARVGGIEYNRTHHATMLKDNLDIVSTMIEASRKANVERFLVVSSACVYPRQCSIPTPETEGFLDEPEPTNGGYGWAKRMAEKLGQYYSEEFDMKVGISRPYNCYGPRDHFDPAFSHVIPALIKRVLDGENPVKVWGSGKQTRAFLYVEDLAEGMILNIEKYPEPDPVNLGSDEEVSMTDLVKRVIKLAHVKAAVEFDKSKPDGSIRRNSDNKKAKHKLSFKARVPLDVGLTNTIAWYRNEYRK